MLKIITAPNPVLSNIAKPVPIKPRFNRGKSRHVSKVDSSVQELVEEMKKTLTATVDPKGVGLAAPQVGRSLRIFIAKPTSKSKIHVFINPKIILKNKISHLITDNDRRKMLNENPKKLQETKLEGCLSLPNIWGKVERGSSVKIFYMDGQGKNHTKEFTGFISTIIQHEMDHLNGILFPKKVLEQKGILYKSSKNEKGEDIFGEIEI